MKMAKKIIKLVKKLCIAFVMLYGLNLILTSVDIFFPINIISLSLVTLLGIPGLLSLVIVFFLI